MISSRAVRYDDIYRMDEIKSLSFHIMFLSMIDIINMCIMYRFYTYIYIYINIIKKIIMIYLYV